MPTVRLRHRRAKGHCARPARLTFVFKRKQSACQTLGTLNGAMLLPEVIPGIAFVDGIKRHGAA